ncbi:MULTISPECIES: DUF2949 domain-containing protein [Prochlorococcus]|uniref:DUF2949 domain-containing protein n=1 Tax=Prochlorococcus TaxID=1218 RepID=UPI000A5921C1|nr:MULTISPECIES: DUF2949 domain-containing protein [Prochlorococcus]
MPSDELCLYLKRKFALTDKAIELGIKKSIEENAPLSIILWSYGLITVSQYQTLLDWINQN